MRNWILLASGHWITDWLELRMESDCQIIHGLILPFCKATQKKTPKNQKAINQFILLNAIPCEKLP